MTAPRAVGVRTPYDAVPAAVRTWVESTLGVPVVSAEEQVGGMSPGCATRVVGADGTRAFVKAVGASLNPDTPTLFRREVAVLERLGVHVLWARLLASYDDGDWVALLLEDVEGRHPDFGDTADLLSVLDGTDRLAEVLSTRVPDADAWDGPVPLVSVAEALRKWSRTLGSLDDTPTAPLPSWVRAQAPGWHDVLAGLAAERSGGLVHWDIRNDNLLRRPDGTVVFLDWGNAAVGPDWVDPLLARLELVDDPSFDASVAASPALAAAGDDAVTAFLVGFGAHMAVRTVTAVDVNLPTLNDFRLTESRRLLGAAARRLGLGGA